MKTRRILALLSGALSTGAGAIHLQKRTDGAPRVVAFPIEHKLNHVSKPSYPLQGRGIVDATLDNVITFYFANITIGTPPQSIRVSLNTGRSNLWVNTGTSTFCEGDDNPCSFSGSYNPNSSSTYSYITSDFNVTHADQTGASGDYVSDTLSIGSITLPLMQFGVGYTSSIMEGDLGIGLQSDEGYVDIERPATATQKSLSAQMVANGLIQSNAYSLWLNDLQASTGNILFGGVDVAHYHPPLHTLPIQRDLNGSSFSYITLTDVNFGSIIIAKHQAISASLESSSSLTYLPDDITDAIFQEVGAIYDPIIGYPIVPCSQGSNENTLNFTFSSLTIAIPMTELVVPLTSTETGNALTFPDGRDACAFGISPAQGGRVTLGATFMRSVYIVFDLSNNEISMAQTIFNATGTNLLEIGTGRAAVPGATLVQNIAMATPTAADRALLTSATPTEPGLKGTATSTAGGAEKTASLMNIAAMVFVAGAGAFLTGT